MRPLSCSIFAGYNARITFYARRIEGESFPRLVPLRAAGESSVFRCFPRRKTTPCTQTNNIQGRRRDASRFSSGQGSSKCAERFPDRGDIRACDLRAAHIGAVREKLELRMSPGAPSTGARPLALFTIVPSPYLHLERSLSFWRFLLAGRCSKCCHLLQQRPATSLF